MALLTNQKQFSRVRKLIKRLCCNYDQGHFLLLDDGERSPCIQILTVSSICCNHFLKAVLPADKKLCEEILNTNQRRTNGRKD